MKYSIEKIAWIDCIFAPMEDANSVTVWIMCKAWSINETLEQAWIAHCLEHMFFKWWDRYKSQKEVSEKLDSIWAMYNAFTTHDTVWYFVKSAPDFVNVSIDVLGDMLMNAKFDSQELEKEKWVIIQEMKMYEDNPMSLIYDKQREWYLWDNSFGRPVIWNEQTVMSFTHDDLVKYRKSLYTKDNLIVVVAGKWADRDEVKKMIEDQFSWLWEKRSVPYPKFQLSLPTEKSAFYKKWTEQNHLIMMFPWFDWNDEKRYAARVLAAILWWNMSSRLFQNIRTKEWLCYYVSSYHEAGVDFGNFSIRAWMDKSRFEFWLQRIKEEVDNYVKNWTTMDEFETTIGYLQWQIQMWIETSEEMASFLGDQYLMYGKIESLDELLEHYKNLTLDDVNALCPMLDLENCYSYHIE